MKTGIELIAKEREEHVTKHHINTGMDVIHNANYQLAWAAIELSHPIEVVSQLERPDGWDKELWAKMACKPYKERLIIAGALIAAEIDRLQATK